MVREGFWENSGIVTGLIKIEKTLKTIFKRLINHLYIANLYSLSLCLPPHSQMSLCFYPVPSFKNLVLSSVHLFPTYLVSPSN